MATENNYNNQDGMIVSSLVKDIKLWKRQDEINSELVDAMKRAESSCAYLICTTPGDISEKSIELPDFTVSTNIRFLVRMEYAHTNEETTPTLNIGGTGDKGIIYNGKEASYLNTWGDDEVLDLYYDGETYISTPHLNVDDAPTEYSKNLVRSGGVKRELININLDIHGVEPGDYLSPDSVFIPEGEPGITSESIMKEFITDFKMLIERDLNYEYGIYQVNSGTPSGLDDSFGIFLFRYPSGEEPGSDNLESIGKFTSEEQPEDGKIYIVGLEENVAEVTVNWSSLEEPWDSTTPYAGIGLGVRYNQDYIFYHGTSIDDKLEEINEKIDSLDEDVSGLETRVTELNTRVTGLDTRITELDERVTEEITNINIDIHGVEPGDYLSPDSVFIPEGEPGITSESKMKEFITDFKMLIERDSDYEYGIYQVNSGIPSGLSDSFGIFLFRYPLGEEPGEGDNLEGIGKFISEEQPEDGKIYIVGSEENIAEVTVNWSSLEEPWDSTTLYAGVGLGVRYNQNYIFYHGTSIDDKLEDISGEIDSLNEDVSGLDTRITGLDTRITELNTRVTGLDTRLTELNTRLDELDERVTEEITNINIDIHGVEPGDYLSPDSVFIPEDEPGITSESMMKEFITDFKMLIERDPDYEYGIYQVNSGTPSGLDDSFGIFLFRYPLGEEPEDDNLESIGKFTSEEQPEDGKIYIVGLEENVAEVVVNWSSLEEPWDSTTPYAGIGLGVRYNQNYIFYHGTCIDDKLEDISGEIDSLNEDVSGLDTSVTGLDERVTALETLDNIEICTPDVIFAVVGDTLQLYYDSMFRCVNYHNYNINITCDIGHQYPRYFEVTPEAWQTGRHSLDIKICDNNNNVISSRNVGLEVIAVAGSPSNKKYVLCIGSQYTRSGDWVSEFNRRLVGTGGTPAGLELTNIVFLGRRRANNINFEAVNGFGFKEYTEKVNQCVFTVPSATLKMIRIGDVYTTGQDDEFTVYEFNFNDGELICNCDDTVAPGTSGTLTKVSGSGPYTISYSGCYFNVNPFIYGDSIDLRQYTIDYCDSNPIDVIYTDLFSGISSNGLTSFSDIIDFTAMRTFIDHCKDAFPNVRICIGLPWCPDTKGGMGDNYGASSWSNAYGLKYTYLNLCNQLQDYITDNNLGSYVFICNWLNEFDSESNFYQISKKRNVRMPDRPTTEILEPVEIFGDNGILPSNYGYFQMADSAFRLFVTNFCR